MRAERLLAHFERVADAPDAIPRLRRFILDLAVRGKLVEQDPNDEPASELLKQFAIERRDRTDKGEIKKSKAPLAIDSPPFVAPHGWIWLPLGETGHIFTGNSINAATKEHLSKIMDGYPFIATKDVGFGFDTLNYDNGLKVDVKDNNFKVARSYAVFICAEGGSAGRKIGISDRPICFGNKLLANETWTSINPRFVLFVYLSSFFYHEFVAQMTGVIGGISINKFQRLPFPLPPLAEQHRIVTKVDELIALCDELEAAQAEQETTRERLTAASLARLNEPGPETFQDDARFTLDALPALTKYPDQIKQLRRTILNLAVRGKLVEQDPNDEPASELLKRISVTKSRSRRKNKGESEPYELPTTWIWTTFDKLITTGPQNGISPKPTTRTDTPKAITLTATTSGVFKPGYFKHVEANIPDESEFWLRDGDLIFQRGNTREYVGIAAIYEGPPKTFLFPDLIMRVRISPLISLRFVHLTAISPPARYYFSDNASGAQPTMPKINQTTLVSLPIPLPPLAEQHRIVAKVDELMAIFDQLEASLTNGDKTRSRLLDALLAEATGA